MAADSDKKEKIAGNKMRLTTAIKKQTVGPLLKLAILTEYENDQWKVIAVFVDELVDQEKDYSVFERELQTVSCQRLSPFQKSIV